MTRIANPIPDGPSPGGPYSGSVRIGNVVAVAGQCGYLPDRSIVEGGVAAQTRLAMQNVEVALAAAGATFDDVISTSAYLVNVDDFAGFNEIYAPFFSDPRPARTTIYCGLRPGVLVEVSVMAVLPDA
jgi:2-iminobutanoate/2-iminopropanoate deaminase